MQISCGPDTWDSHLLGGTLMFSIKRGRFHFYFFQFTKRHNNFAPRERWTNWTAVCTHGPTMNHSQNVPHLSLYTHTVDAPHLKCASQNGAVTCLEDSDGVFACECPTSLSNFPSAIHAPREEKILKTQAFQELLSNDSHARNNKGVRISDLMLP